MKETRKSLYEDQNVHIMMAKSSGNLGNTDKIALLEASSKMIKVFSQLASPALVKSRKQVIDARAFLRVRNR